MFRRAAIAAIIRCRSRRAAARGGMLHEALMRIQYCVLVVLLAAGAGLSAQAPPAKADLVMVAGCLREQPAGNWRVVNATEPKPSNAVAPLPGELPAMP